MLGFRDSWLSKSTYIGWLEKVDGDENKAYCSVCKKVMRAVRSDLTGHSKSRRHLEKVAEAAAYAAMVARNAAQPVRVQLRIAIQSAVDAVATARAAARAAIQAADIVMSTLEAVIVAQR